MVVLKNETAECTGATRESGNKDSVSSEETALKEFCQ